MNSPKLKPMIPFLCICIGSLVAIIAAYVDYQNKLKDKQDQLDTEIKRNSEYQNIINKNDALIEKSNDIIISQKTVIDTTSKIIELQNELNAKNEEINRLQNKTLETIRGTDQPPIFLLASNLYVVAFSVKNELISLPAFFNFIIYDYSDLKKCKMRTNNIIDVNCVNNATLANVGDVKLNPQSDLPIFLSKSISINIGNIYKYLIYSEINGNKYL